MSEQSTTLADLTRHAYACLNSRDFDAVIGLFGPASVWDVSRRGLGSHTGVDAIRHFLEDWFGSLENYEVQAADIRELGNGVVSLTVLQLAERAGARGLLRVRSGVVIIWADRTIERVTIYPDIPAARAAAERLAQERG